MTTTDRDASALAHLAHELREEVRAKRPAPKWDKPGIDKTTAGWVGKLSLATAVERIQHATDPDAQTPAAMNRPWAPHPTGPGPVMPPKPDEACQECGRHTERCICETAPEARPRTRSEAREARAAELRREKAQAAIDGVGKRAPLCSHGVPRTHCVDHRNTDPEGEA